MRTRWFVLLIVECLLAAVAAFAADPPPAAGMGRYIMVLRQPGERRDSPKQIKEPDVTKLGGGGGFEV